MWQSVSKTSLKLKYDVHCDAGTVRPEILEGLLIGSSSGSCDHSSVRSKAIWDGSLDGLDDILLRLEVDPLVGT